MKAAEKSSRGEMSIRFHIRSFRRFPIHCRVHYSNDEGQGIGTIWNLSLNGWRVDGSLAVRPGMTLRLWVFLPNEGPTLFVDRVTVRWARGQEFGLETSAIGETDERYLKRLVASLV